MSASFLQCAAEGNVARVKALVTAGVDINMADSNGETALHKAIKKKHPDVAAALIDLGCELDSQTVGMKETPLIYALTMGDEATVNALVRAGASFDITEPAQGSLLLYAATGGLGGKWIRLILRETGCDINAANKDGYTALHLAADKGQTSVVSELLHHGAKPEARAHDGRTPKDMVLSNRKRSDETKAAICAILDYAPESENVSDNSPLGMVRGSPRDLRTMTVAERHARHKRDKSPQPSESRASSEADSNVGGASLETSLMSQSSPQLGGRARVADGGAGASQPVITAHPASRKKAQTSKGGGGGSGESESDGEGDNPDGWPADRPVGEEGGDVDGQHYYYYGESNKGGNWGGPSTPPRRSGAYRSSNLRPASASRVDRAAGGDYYDGDGGRGGGSLSDDDRPMTMSPLSKRLAANIPSMLDRLPRTWPRVIAYRNGEKDKYVTVCAPTVERIIEAATRKLGLIHLGKRLFNEEGLEVHDIDELEPDAIVFVSCGEGFRDPFGDPLPWTKAVDDGGNVRHVTKVVGAPSSLGAADVLAVLVCRNGDKTAKFVPTIFPIADKYDESARMNLLLDACTRKLGLNRPARYIFETDGSRVTNTDDIYKKQKLVVSMGEPFYDPYDPDPTPWVPAGDGDGDGGSDSDSSVHSGSSSGSGSGREGKKWGRGGLKRAKSARHRHTHIEPGEFANDIRLRGAVRVPLFFRRNGYGKETGTRKVLLSPEKDWSHHNGGAQCDEAKEYEVWRWNTLLADATAALGMTAAVTRLFRSSDGREVKSVAELSRGDELVASPGPDYQPAWEPNRTIHPPVGQHYFDRQIQPCRYMRLYARRNGTVPVGKGNAGVVVLAPPAGDKLKPADALGILLDDCTSKLDYNVSARRVFIVNKEGVEVTPANYFRVLERDDKIAVSLGQNYIDTDADDETRGAKEERPPPTTPIDNEAMRRLAGRRPATRLRCMRNGWTKLCDPTIIIGHTVKDLEEAATNNLGVTLPVRALYKATGERITDVRQVEKDEMVYASLGEAFVSPIAPAVIEPKRLFATLNGGNIHRGVYVTAPGVENDEDRKLAMRELKAECQEALGLYQKVKRIYFNSGSELLPSRYHALKSGDTVRVSLGEAFIRDQDLDKVRKRARAARSGSPRRTASPQPSPSRKSIVKRVRYQRLSAFRNGLWGQDEGDARPVVATNLYEFLKEATVILGLTAPAAAVFTYFGEAILTDEEFQSLPKDTAVFVSMGEPYKPYQLSSDARSQRSMDTGGAGADSVAEGSVA